jgi:hypothetical protein
MTNGLQKTGSFSRTQQLLSQSANSLQSPEPEAPLPFSQNSNCPCSEPDQSRPQLIQHIHSHSHSLRRFAVRGHVQGSFLPFRKHTTFLRQGFVRLSLNTQARKPPAVGSPLLPMQYTGSYCRSLQVVSSVRNLRTRHAVATRRERVVGKVWDTSRLPVREANLYKRLA